MRDVLISKLRLTDGSTRYRVRQELDPDPETGKRQWLSETFRTHDAAKERRRELLLTPAQRAQRMTLRAYLVDHWLPQYRAAVSASSYRKRRIEVERWLLPHLGTLTLGTLGARDIEAAARDMAQAGASPARVKAVIGTLAVALNAAVRAEMLAEHPCKHVRLQRAEPSPPRAIWTPQQAQTFLSGQRGIWRALWTTILGTGMRLSEARALRWMDVDLAGRTIAIRQTWARGDDGWYLAQPKSAAGRRTVVIPAGVAKELQAWRTFQQGHARAHDLPLTEATWVFCRDDLTPLPEQTVQIRWRASVAAAGLPYITIHGMRHMAVTEQLNAGVPLKVVSARIGHSSIGLTADLYGHVLRDHQEAAATALEGLITSQRDQDVTPQRRASRKPRVVVRKRR